MSDQLAAAANQMGVPEPLVERAARAKAEETGQDYDEILTAWAGGEAAASTPAAPEAMEPDQPAEEPPADSAEEPPAPAAQPAAAPEAPQEAPVRPAAGGRPPILEAPADRPLVPVAGGIGVVVLTILLAFVFPSVPASSNEVRSSIVAYTATAEQGRSVYLRAGCASCHTQAVRAVVADVGIGPVSLADTNQVLGYRRLGPDLSDVGTRLGTDQLANLIAGSSHPALPLSDEALEALVTYLSESALSPPETEEESETGAEEPAEREAADPEEGES